MADSDLSKGKPLDDDEIALFADTIDGLVLLPGDMAYDEECARFNLPVSHAPQMIIVPVDAVDVQAAVRFAAAHALPIAVQNTGHGPFFPGTTGCLLIKTSALNSVEVDVTQRTARVGTGALWGDVAEQTAPAGLAPLSGSAPSVGVGGHVLGGGISPIMGRKYGWAADHVSAAEVVTADGVLRRVDSASEPDLFWAVRGGQSNFGVVTTLEIDLFPLDMFYGGDLFFEGAHTTAVLHAYRELIAAAPDDLSSSICLLRLPALPSVPEFLHDRFVVHVRIAYLGASHDGERLIAPMRAAAPMIADTVAEIRYADFGRTHQDPTDPLPYRERTGMLTEWTAEGVDALADVAGPDSGCGMTLVEVRHIGGALGRPPREPNAVSNRDAEVIVRGAAMGGPEQIESAMSQMEELLRRLQPWSTGKKYLNFMSEEEPTEYSYSQETFERLRSVKNRYDPANIFRSR
jgi:FAD/FMN-containing dehydrogenase